MSGTDNEGIRLNKYIASSGLCSRREADTLIENGKVTINGEVAVQGTKVNEPIIRPVSSTVRLHSYQLVMIEGSKLA